MTLLGYARVSTLHQSPGMQTKALTEAGAEKIWTERMSGARDDHPELAALLDYARRGDVLMVWRLDRRGPLTPPPAHESPVTSFACRGYSRRHSFRTSRTHTAAKHLDSRGVRRSTTRGGTIRVGEKGSLTTTPPL